MITKWLKLSSGVGGARGELLSSTLQQGRAGGSDAKRQNRNSITARRASAEEKSTKEATPCRNGATTTSRRSTRISLNGTACRRAQPTAGKKSIPNSIPDSRRESKEQSEQHQLQAETYEENNVSKKQVGPMRRNKDTESHRRMAAEQELKVAEKAGEHQVKIGTKIEVEKQKAAELRKPGADCQEIA